MLLLMYQPAQHVTGMNYNQKFASDPDYIFFARSVSEKYVLRSSVLQCIKENQVNWLKKQLREITIQKSTASDNRFSFMRQVKGTPAY